MDWVTNRRPKGWNQGREGEVGEEIETDGKGRERQ